MARITLPLIHLSPLLNNSSPETISSVFNPSSSTTNTTTATGWSSKVYFTSTTFASNFLLKRHEYSNNYTNGIPKHQTETHFNHQLFPNSSGPFDLLLSVHSVHKNITTTQSEHSLTTATTAPTTPISPASNTNLLQLQLTCRVGTICLHFTLKDCFVEILNTEISTECHLSRTTAAQLRRLASRWCPIVSYCTAAAVAHPGWTNDSNAIPTHQKPIVICPCASGIKLIWIENDHGNGHGKKNKNKNKKKTSPSKKRQRSSSTNQSKSKYVVVNDDEDGDGNDNSDVVLHTTHFIFDVEKYGIRIERDDILLFKLMQESSSSTNGFENNSNNNNSNNNNNKTASFWQKVMASCIKNQQRTERDQLKENVYKQMLLLPMGMDESLPFPLVPHLDSFIITSGISKMNDMACKFISKKNL